MKMFFNGFISVFKKINIVDLLSLSFICFFIALLIVGCTYKSDSVTSDVVEGSSIDDSSINSSTFLMEQVSVRSLYDEGFIYYRDTVTDVLYVWRKGGYAGGLTVMLDPATGFPLTYSRYLEIVSNSGDQP